MISWFFDFSFLCISNNPKYLIHILFIIYLIGFALTTCQGWFLYTNIWTNPFIKSSFLTLIKPRILTVERHIIKVPWPFRSHKFLVWFEIILIERDPNSIIKRFRCLMCHVEWSSLWRTFNSANRCLTMIETFVLSRHYHMKNRNTSILGLESSLDPFVDGFDDV